MLAEIAAAIKPNEERLTLGGVSLIVREMAAADELGGDGSPEDIFMRVVVRCVFNEAGELVMSDADIPELKAAGKTKLRPLLDAVQRVNGLVQEDNTEKPAPGPA